MAEFNNIPKRTLYLDCSSGISGDMTVAALLDLGADKQVLLSALNSLPLNGYHIEITDVIKSGLRACDFNVILEQDNHDHDMAYLHGNQDHHKQTSAHAHHDHPHGHDHHEHTHLHNHHDHSHDHAKNHVHHEHTQEPHHSHHGRNLLDITAILSSGNLTANALNLALKIFGIVAQAESQVHGKPLEEVHFHEVGAVDSIVDIASVAICLDNLGIKEVILPYLTEGTGQVRCQHGLLPIPVPATTAIVTAHQLPLRICDVQGELVTPTGAAIAAAIRTADKLPAEFKILKTGLGAGKRDYKTAGVLRAMLIEETALHPNREENSTNTDFHTDHDTILILETNMDDCYGEAMGFTMEELLDKGALDVFYTPIYMKKHRPAYKLTVLCAPQKRTAMEEIIFRHTTSIGIRIYEAERSKLPRKIITLETPWGMADIKCCQHGENTYYYPESDSIQELAKTNSISFSEMYHEVKKYASEAHTIL